MADQEKGGKLYVFLGGALELARHTPCSAARERQKPKSIDIVIGIAETHGCCETEALMEGLEVLPRRKVGYCGRTIEEFDIDAALARKRN